jgi:hypothetical protein
MAVEPIKYQHLLERVGRGECWSAYLDDTGPGGQSQSPTTLPHDRRTYVSMILSPSDGAVLMREMPALLQEVERHTGARELHFAHIYAGKREFKGVDLQLRLALVDAMVQIVAEHKFPVLVQSIDATYATKLVAEFGALDRPKDFPFDFERFDELALFLTLWRSKQFLQSRVSETTKAVVFVDEGWKRDGIAMRIPAWEEVFERGLVCFANSASIWGLQLADLAGFVLTRWQLLAGRAELSELDRSFLEIAEPLKECFVDLTAAEITYSSGATTLKPA